MSILGKEKNLHPIRVQLFKKKKSATLSKVRRKDEWPFPCSMKLNHLQIVISNELMSWREGWLRQVL